MCDLAQPADFTDEQIRANPWDLLHALPAMSKLDKLHLVAARLGTLPDAPKLIGPETLVTEICADPFATAATVAVSTTGCLKYFEFVQR